MNDRLPFVIGRIVSARKTETEQSSSGRHSSEELVAVIGRIRTVYHEDWESQKLSFAEAFIANVSQGIPVPALSVCGHGTAETRYTQYLAHFLNPAKLHGLGSAYLDAVLALLRRSNPEITSDIDTARAETIPECHLGQIHGENRKLVGCDIDVVVECPSHVIFIENKIKAGQSPHKHSKDDQLTRYDKAIDANDRYDDLGQVRIYLTPDGDDRSGLYPWIGMSHNDLAEAGLDLLRAGSLSSPAQENLIRFLVDLLLGPYDKFEDEVRDLKELATGAIQKHFPSRVRFDHAVSRNRMLVEVLMEGSQ